MDNEGERNFAFVLNKILKEIKNNEEQTDMTMFYARMGMHFKDLYKNFLRLYGDREDFYEKLKQLTVVLAQSYTEREEELKKLDLAREQNSEWILSQEWVGTMLYVDRYAENLKEFKTKIDYLKELGVNYVHLMPLLKSPEKENDGGYAVSDYREVDKRFGTMKDINDISKIFREKNMLLVMDLVINHTADEHEWAQKALAGEKKYQDFYYMYDNREIPDKFEETLPEVFPDLAPGNFTYRDEINKWVFTVFNKFQWDLNYTNPDVFIEMTKILLFIANQGVDVLRLDAVAFMWKRLGTNSQNEPEVHSILQAFKACAKIVAPGVVFKAEAIVQPTEIVKYLGEGEAAGKECEIAYNASYMVFLWDAIATKNTRLLTKGLENMPRLPKGTTWVNYIRCHDDIGLGFDDRDAKQSGYDPQMHRKFLIDYYTEGYYGSMSEGAKFMYNPKTGDARISGTLASLCGLEKSLKNNNKREIEKAIRKILLLHSGIMSFGGMPLIYYGDEIGTMNDVTYIEDDTKREDNRWMHRPKMNWEKAEKRKTEGTIENRIFSGIKNMIAVRKQIPEFYGENDYELIKSENMTIFSFLREYENSKTLVIMNFSDMPQSLNEGILKKVDINKDKCVNILTDKNPKIEDGMIVLEPYEFLWLREVEK